MVSNLKLRQEDMKLNCPVWQFNIFITANILMKTEIILLFVHFWKNLYKGI